MKSKRIGDIIKNFVGRKEDPHYLAFFECFNKQLFFEAHEVLEVLWLPQRGCADGAFFKGLIQLAGAFVHVQRNRAQPALALLELAKANLQLYQGFHHQLEIKRALVLVEDWREKIKTSVTRGDLTSALKQGPKLLLG